MSCTRSSVRIYDNLPWALLTRFTLAKIFELLKYSINVVLFCLRAIVWVECLFLRMQLFPEIGQIHMKLGIEG